MKFSSTRMKTAPDLVVSNRHRLVDKFLKYLWITGLYYSPTEVLFSSKTCNLRRIYRYSVALMVVTVAILGLADYVVYFLSEIATLDFFVLVKLINNVSVCIQIPIIYLIYLCCNSRMALLIHKFGATMAQVLTANERRRTEKFITLLAFAWVIGGLLLHTVCSIRYHWPWLTDTATLLAWKFHIVVIGGVPGWALVSFNYGVYALCIVIDGTAQIFYIVLILYLAVGFRKVKVELESSSMNSEDTGNSGMEALAVAKKDIQLLKNLTCCFNDTFGLLITVNCIRDLIAMVATVAVLLEQSGQVLSPEEYLQYKKNSENEYLWHHGFTVLTMLNAALRIGTCILCHSCVRKVTRVLHEIETDSDSPIMQRECEKMARRIEGAGLISATGFSAINVQYVFGVLGMLITYAILIFQTSDGRVGSRDYARKEDISALSKELQIIKSLPDTMSKIIRKNFSSITGNISNLIYN